MDDFDRVFITKRFAGLGTMQVCTASDATDEEILSVCNQDTDKILNSQEIETDHPTWNHVIREGELAPVQCEKHPSRKHIIVEM